MKTIHKISMSLLIAALSLLTSCEISTGEGEDGYGYGVGDYKLGDTGPGGGKIFYVNPKGFTVQGHPSFGESYTAYYLEAAPVDQHAGLVWAVTAASVPGDATATGIGAGRKNTVLIVAQNGTGTYAARACYDYRGPENKIDWFLPSLEELNILYTNMDYVGTFSISRPYGSSSEYSGAYSGYAWAQMFGDGGQGMYLKTSDLLSVRAIRAF